MRLALALVLLVACDPKEPVALGSSCSTTGKEACAVGKLAQCSGGKWQETLICTGPAACQRKTFGHGMTAPICDEGLGRVGNVCSSIMQLACSEDRHAQLVCSSGRWTVQKTCPNGCSYPKNQVTCQ
jgi:hypothetical protein